MQSSVKQFLIFPPTNFVDLQNVSLNCQGHSHLALPTFFVLRPYDSVGTVTFQSPAGQAAFSLFQ